MKLTDCFPELDLAVPHDHKCPEAGYYEEYQVAQQGPLHAVKRAYQADYSDNNCTNEDSGAKECTEG